MAWRSATTAMSTQRKSQAPVDYSPTPYYDTYERSPPRTPPSPTERPLKNKNVSRLPQNRFIVREGLSPEHRTEEGSVERRHGHRRVSNDSHDLSLTHVARNSVVDNMLLSLDQINVRESPPRGSSLTKPRLLSTFDEEDSSIRAPRTAETEAGRVHAHSHSISYSSDLDHPADDSASRYSQGHHSNSSSNYQRTLRRIHSGLTEDDTIKGRREKTYEAQRLAGLTENIGLSNNSAGRKDSKSSASSSLEHGQMVGGPRWQRAIQRRSSSFDHGYTNRGTHTHNLDMKAYQPMGSIQSHQQDIHDYEAAPTPTIPVGPRKDQSQSTATAMSPRLPLGQPPVIPLRRKNSIKSSKSGHVKKERLDTFGPATTRTPIDEASDATYNRQEQPPFPSSTNSGSLYQDTVQCKPSIKLVQEPANSVKEKPGFFKRVFGSSRQNTLAGWDTRPPPSIRGVAPSSGSSIRTESRTGHVPSEPPVTKLGKATSWAEAEGSLYHAPLNKKTSFFRRRKKSVSESLPLPAPPLQLPPEVFEPSGSHAAESSPVSSLRQVMNPFLGNPSTSQHYRENLARSNGDVHEYDVSFLADYAARNKPSLKSNVYTSQARSGPTDARSSRDRNLSSSDGPTASRRSDFDAHPSSEGLFFAATSSKEEHNLQSRLQRVRTENEKPETPPKQRLTVIAVPNQAVRHNENNKPDPTATDPFRLSPKTSVADVKALSSRSGNMYAHDHAANTAPRNVETNARSAVDTAVSLKDDSYSNDLESRSDPVHIGPAASEEGVHKANKTPVPQQSRDNSARASASSVSDYLSASSKIPSPLIAGSGPESQDACTEAKLVEDILEADNGEPTEKDRIQAKSIYDGDEDVVDTAKAAPWLGESDVERTRIRRAYMELFDWQNRNILAALRDLCGRLVLKAETQQVDRILDAFSTRWCVCNPSHGFKATDVVHTICYSILLLNTDLHMAEIEQKMTRAQFIRNTMPTIRRVAADAAPDGFETVRTPSLVPRSQLPWPDMPVGGRSPSLPAEATDRRSSLDAQRPIHTLSTRPSENSGQESSWSQVPTPLDYDTPVDDCGPLVKAPFYGKLSTWEVQVEIVLKDFYNSIRQQRLPLSGSEDFDQMPEPTPTSTSLSALTGSMLRRTPSMLSKAGSESHNSRGRLLENKIGTGRWTSKGRSRPRLYPTSTVGSSRTSFDDQSSMWSPSASSTWSKYSLGKTQTSMSVNSFASSFPQGDYKQSIGFANALSQAIIREDAAGNNQSDENIRIAPLLEDETLELAGAPWAKEGILKHKHHLESIDKKAKGRNWMESFAVIEKGWMRLFSFNMNARSMRQKMRSQKAPGGVVGGGNWTENAESIGKFLLRQTIASALPPPGYSKTRPHVWALSLPTGAVHLFQVGTPEIVKEFVTTANYWSARLSKEPLVGGVSNIEYGWGDSVINHALLHSDNRPPTASNAVSRPSLQSSIRSSMDQGSLRPKLPGDRVVISDWSPPPQSMMASALMEVDQLKGLLAYVKNVEEELQKHNELRSAMLLVFSPRHPNHGKAMINWERKSSYLLYEIVKFRTYIDCLQAAETQKEKIYAEKAAKTNDEGGEQTQNEEQLSGEITADTTNPIEAKTT